MRNSKHLRKIPFKMASDTCSLLSELVVWCVLFIEFRDVVCIVVI